MILSALSIQQPWAYAIFNLEKDVENRSWSLPNSKEKQLVLIHAGKKIDNAGIKYLKQKGYSLPDNFLTGGIVGCVMFSRNSNLKSNSVWATPNMYNWTILHNMSLPYFTCKGRLGFFKVDYPHCQTLLQNIAL